MCSAAFRRAVRWCAAGVGLAGMLAVTACQSPLLPEESGEGSARYTEALLARAVMEGKYNGQIASLPTIPWGVREERRAVSAVSLGLPEAPAASSPMAPETQATGQGLDLNPGTTQPTRELGKRPGTLGLGVRVVRLSLQETLARAMRHSLAIKVEGYNPAIKETLIVQQEGAYDPILFGQSQWNSTDEPPNQPKTSPLISNNGQTWQNQVGIKQLLPTGGTAQAIANSTYHTVGRPNNLSNFAFKNSNAANLNLQLTQPLLRGFGVEVNEAAIYVAQVDRRISQETFKRQVIKTAADVEEAYHNLMLSQVNVVILEDLVDKSIESQVRVYARKSIDADDVSISQVDAAVATHQAELSRARSVRSSQSDRLKSLLNDPELNIAENVLIEATDEPISEPVIYSTADLIVTALRQRTELQEARLQIERADIAVRVAKNGLLPKVDLTIGVQSNGLEGSLDSAFESTVNPGHWIDFNAGIKIEIPLGNREAQGLLEQKRLERSQAITAMFAAAQNTVTDVLIQLREVLSNYEQIALLSTVVTAQERQLTGLIAQEVKTKLTPEYLQLKLDTEARVAAAQQSLIQAKVNYNLAIMRLEQAKGTLLEYDRISLDRAPANLRGYEQVPGLAPAGYFTK